MVDSRENEDQNHFLVKKYPLKQVPGFIMRDSQNQKYQPNPSFSQIIHLGVSMGIVVLLKTKIQPYVLDFYYPQAKLAWNISQFFFSCY